MAYSRCGRCEELRFDDKINLCANCGYRILRTSKSYEWNFTINQRCKRIKKLESDLKQQKTRIGKLEKRITSLVNEKILVLG